jgi:hypothetical protein
LAQAAARLGLSVRTVQRWLAAWARDRLHAARRGRPARRSQGRARARALELMAELGPGVGVPVLQALCPEMARREVEDLLARSPPTWCSRPPERPRFGPDYSQSAPGLVAADSNGRDRGGVALWRATPP